MVGGRRNADCGTLEFGMRNSECGMPDRCRVFSVSISVYRWFILRYFTTDKSDGTDENQPILNSEFGIRIAEWR